MYYSIQNKETRQLFNIGLNSTSLDVLQDEVTDYLLSSPSFTPEERAEILQWDIPSLIAEAIPNVRVCRHSEKEPNDNLISLHR